MECRCELAPRQYSCLADRNQTAEARDLGGDSFRAKISKFSEFQRQSFVAIEVWHNDNVPDLIAVIKASAEPSPLSVSIPLVPSVPPFPRTFHQTPLGKRCPLWTE